MPPIVEITDEAGLPACLAVLRASFATVAAELGLTAATVPAHPAFWTLERLVRAHRSGTRLFAAAEEGALIGTVSVAVAGGVAEMQRLAVVPAHRHRGHGARLVAHALAVAEGAGASRVTLAVVADAARLEEWYGRLGFTVAGDRRYAHLPFTVRHLERSLGHE